MRDGARILRTGRQRPDRTPGRLITEGPTDGRLEEPGSVGRGLGASLFLRPGWVSTNLHLAPSRPPSKFLFAIVLFTSLVLTGCKPVGPNYNRPGYNAPPAYNEAGASTVVPPPNPAGGAWQPANPSDGMLKGKWWEIYRDAQLNSLEERIDSNNVQLRQAMETYLAARDQVR
ncbi:MAG: hypothetical protein ACLQGT_03420 [Terracidiphilus sp.]